MHASTSKLTLSIDKSVIEKAKKYAQKRGKSVSKIVQDYLSTISKKELATSNRKIGPITNELYGILKGKDPSDLHSEIAVYLEKKYK